MFETSPWIISRSGKKLRGISLRDGQGYSVFQFEVSAATR